MSSTGAVAYSGSLLTDHTRDELLRMSRGLAVVLLVVYVRAWVWGMRGGGEVAADGRLRARPCPPLYPLAASWVIDACAVLGIPGETVTWRGDAVVSNRAARV